MIFKSGLFPIQLLLTIPGGTSPFTNDSFHTDDSINTDNFELSEESFYMFK